MRPKLIPTFLARYPGVSVEVAMDNTFIDVIAAGYDAGVRYEESLAKDMIAVPIGPRRQRFVAAASPGYLQQNGTPLSTRTTRMSNRSPCFALQLGRVGLRQKA